MPNRPLTPLTLDRLPTRVQAVIRHINTQTAHGKALQRRLMELGFVPGGRARGGFDLCPAPTGILADRGRSCVIKA